MNCTFQIKNLWKLHDYKIWYWRLCGKFILNPTWNLKRYSLNTDLQVNLRNVQPGKNSPWWLIHRLFHNWVHFNLEFSLIGIPLESMLWSSAEAKLIDLDSFYYPCILHTVCNLMVSSYLQCVSILTVSILLCIIS